MNLGYRKILLPPSTTYPESDKEIIDMVRSWNKKQFTPLVSARKKVLASRAAYRRLNPSIRRTKYREYTRKLRNSILEAFGNKCKICGFSDFRALQIDHINGDGRADKRGSVGVYYKRVLESIAAQEGKYQLLCSNCNWIKRYENKEHGWVEE